MSRTMEAFLILVGRKALCAFFKIVRIKGNITPPFHVLLVSWTVGIMGRTE